MGEAQSNIIKPTFNRSVRIQFEDQRLTGNAGLLLLREADSRLGIIESIARNSFDSRRQDRIRYQFQELLRERVYAMALGYSAQDDLDRLAHDPAMRIAVWDRPGQQVLDERLASQPTQSRLVKMIANNLANMEALRTGIFETVRRHVRGNSIDRRVLNATIDMDSFPIEVHGNQEGSSYNGHYECEAYHPLVASFSIAGDYDNTRNSERFGGGFIDAMLRNGNVHTATGAAAFVDRVIVKAKQIAQHVDFRMDAGYTNGEIMDSMTDKNLKFVGRLKSNSRLDALACQYIQRRSGRPPAEGYEYCIELGDYQADSWKHAQRLIVVVVDRPDPETKQLKLFPDYFFLVTNWPKHQRFADQLLNHYRPRGTFEDRLGEFNQAVGVHLSSKLFAENEATLLMAMLAFNLASTLRTEAEEEFDSGWDLERFQSTVLRSAARVTKHARQLFVHVVSSVTKFWRCLSKRIERWNIPADCPEPTCAQRRTYRPPPIHAHLQEVLRS